MKQIGFTLPIIVIVLCGFFSLERNISGQEVLKNEPLMLEYVTEDFKFKFKYPSNWVKNENDLNRNTIVNFSLIQTNKFDFTNKTLASVAVKIYPNINNISTENFPTEEFLQDTVIIDVANIKLDNLTATQAVYYTFEKKTIKNTQIWTILPDSNLLLEIVFFGSPETYSKYYTVVDSMIKSFETL